MGSSESQHCEAPATQEKKISVRGLVEFIVRAGSIDSRFTGRNRLEEGARVHRKLQKDEGYLAEVHLSVTETVSAVAFTVEGRADGVIISESGVTIDEIKSTLTPLDLITEDHSPAHWAQAMCYGHIYCVKNGLERIGIRLTYYEMDTGAIKRFSRGYDAAWLGEFFTGLLEKYAVWVHFESRWKETAASSMKALEFPYESYREGQRRMAAAVYKTIAGEGRLFAMAPTGVGKTISTIFPALKAVGEGYGEKIFYLTAKTVTRRAAQAALDKMRESGLRVKSVTITAKDKICFLDERDCKPGACEYADGHFDRINDAVLEVLNNCDGITAEVIVDYATRCRVCPFELALDLTLWCDVIICDYNYLFDPQVYLKRFFSEGGDYIFLVDEAHNLADRAREMFSASIGKRSFLALKRALGKQAKSLRTKITALNSLLLGMRRECADAGFIEKREPNGELNDMLEAFTFEFSKWLADNPEADRELLETYFGALTYLKIAELYDENPDGYSTLIEAGAGGELTVRQFCVDPSGLLDARFSLGRAAVLFSATLTPAGYFTAVLGGGDNCRYIALPSPFPADGFLLLVADNVSTKYKDRDDSFERVADLIFNTASGKQGNYIAYFPSYSYLSSVHTLFCGKYPGFATACQSPGMAEHERDSFLSLFDEHSASTGTLVAFCVLGGVFSEGVDLVGEKLIGVIITGVGLPQINRELDIVRNHFGGPGRGFDFAYRYPGMNKVLQAAGRVIRSEHDKGVVLLIDDRFTARNYTALFPEHWHGWRAVRSAGDLSDALNGFWQTCRK